jgi:hypothetical protein
MTNKSEISTEQNNRIEQKTQGIDQKGIMNQPQNTTEITKDKDGLQPTRQPLHVDA